MHSSSGLPLNLSLATATTLKHLLTLSLLLLLLTTLPVHAAADTQQLSLKNNDMTTASAQDLAFWASEFQTLRQKKGHFSGGEHDTDVDSYKGKKHTIMESLGKALGVKGNPAVKVLESMGQPDEIVPKVGASNVGPLQAAGPGAITGGMPGPVITGGAPPLTETIPGKNYFLIYYWRGRHDYLWFEVNASDETVEACDWYQAGE